MIPAPSLDDEERRLARLKGLGVLDTGPEAVLDAFTELAASASGLPISLISLIDEDRQWWKAAVRLPQGGATPRAVSFCGHAIAADRLFEVEDARKDPRFADNPTVLGPPHVVHYAGMPLVMPGGERIGTLCLIGHQPGRIDARTRDLLAGLARMVVQVLLLRENEQRQRALAHATAALRESEAKFRTITNAMPQMVWSTRPDGFHDYFNDRWYEFTGTAPGASEGEAWLALYHPDDRARTQAQWARSRETGEPYEIEYRLLHRSGDYRWVLGRALPVRDEGGQILRWIGTCTDIHDQKRAQEKLQAASERKDEFLAMLAHELRNPLAPVSTAAQLLPKVAPDPAQVTRLAGLITRQVGHLTALVDDLMDVSRLTRGLVPLQDELVDLEQVLHDALEQATPAAQARGHRVEVRGDGQRAWVRGDRTRLTQVVSNLLHNAVKYTPSGGLIVLGLRQEGASACLSVADNGSGIDAQLLPHVFDLFTQAQRTPDRAQGGLGLGLTVVRRIVELHRGGVEARSPGPGQGSTFQVCLPLTQPAPAAPPVPQQPAQAAAAPASALRVTVVDDNADAAHSLAQWLRMQGHEARVETDALAMLAQAADAPADAYVLDIGLPGMDGYELARRLRADPRTRGAVLLALTGYGQPDDVAQAHAAGFDHHLVKPADPHQVAALLVQAVRAGAATSREPGRGDAPAPAPP